MSHTESQGYEQIQRVEFQAQSKENKCNLQKTWNHKMVDIIQGATWLWREHKNTGQDDVWECATDQLEEHEEVSSSSERLSAGNFVSRNLLSEHN
ncbi:unnamed protein product [Sphagnum troendelagicum]|uniref:Uncharacterized protein n=1 Tax=Sphagnum troendelagicum TaxID=128251 RepID=A0ABP0TKB0_9BRYO